MSDARLHDGSRIEIEVAGDGPAVLLPVDPVPVDGERAEEMRQWGVDPALGRALMDGLSDRFRVVAFPYERHVMAHPMPDTLTPDAIAADVLAVAAAAGADRFAYYGYSWLAMVGLQLALRTDRLSALAMGGYPPLDGPYAGMLAVTRATHDMALAKAAGTAPPPDPDDPWSELGVSEPQALGFLTLYEALDGFDDRAAQPALRCPRMCFAGSADTIQYGDRWGGALIDLAGPIHRHRPELERLGWTVHLLDGLDHTRAMQPLAVLPILRPWLETTLLG